jgi:hypothetical protein
VVTGWGRRFGWVAAGWAVGFAALHFYWALGGGVGLAVSAGPDLADERPAWFVAGGLWGVGVLLVVAALVGVELARGRLRGARRVLVRIAGYLAGSILVVRAVSVELLLLGGPALDDTVGPAHRFWTLVLWNPWFAVGGIAFLVAGLGYRDVRAAV